MRSPAPVNTRAVGDWLRFTSVPVASFAAALTGAAFLYGGSVPVGHGGWLALLYCAFVSASVLAVYSLDRYVVAWSPEDAINRAEALAWQMTHTRTVPALGVVGSAVGAGLLLVLWPSVPPSATILLVASAVLSFFYCVPIPPVGRLQDRSVLKPFLAALIWTVGTTAIPLSILATPPETVGFGVVSAFLLLSANALLCDVLDIEGDAAAGRRTLAVRLGAERTRRYVRRILFVLFVIYTTLGVVMPVAAQQARFAGWVGVRPILLSFAPAFAALAGLAGSVGTADPIRARLLYDGVLCVPLLAGAFLT